METLPAVLAGPAEPDSDSHVTRLLLGWLMSQESENTRVAYAKDMDPALVPLVQSRERKPSRNRPRPPRVPPWREWCRATRADPVSGVTRDHVNLYARMMSEAGLSASTRQRKLSAISSWYGWLLDDDQIPVNPAIKVKRPKVDRDTSTTPGLTKDQALALLKAADEARGPQVLRTSALIAVMLFTGARVSEVTLADIEDLGTDRGHRVLWVTRKGGKRQPLALPPAVTGRLDTYLASRADVEHLPAVQGAPGGAKPHRPLFIAETGERLWEPDVWHLVRRLGKKAGLPDDLVSRFGPHAVRHTYATLYLDAGGSLRDLQDAMGHADPRTTRRYDRARGVLDRSPGYTLAAYLATDGDTESAVAEG